MAEATYYFNSYSAFGMIQGDTEDNIVDGDTGTYALCGGAGTATLDGNTCDGTDLGTITKVELRGYAYGDGDDKLDLIPEFDGTDTGDSHQETMPTVAAWLAYCDITSDTNAPVSWSWANVQNLDCEVENVAVAKGNWAYIAKIEIRVTYTVATGWGGEFCGVSIDEFCGVTPEEITGV